MFLAIIGGITSEASTISGQLADAKNTIGGWLTDLGIDPPTVDAAKKSADSGVSDSFQALLEGVLGGVKQLSSLAFFLALTALSLLFLLKDGPQIRAWSERHLGLPAPVAKIDQPARARLAARLLPRRHDRRRLQRGRRHDRRADPRRPAGRHDRRGHVHRRLHPLPRRLGAAAFSVLLALGGAGPDAALGMVVVQLLANGILQQMVQPFAMGAALGIHPLAVLIVTIAGGALFGAVGLILAAPVTSALTRIAADLADARAKEQAAAETAAPPATGPPADPAPA